MACSSGASSGVTSRARIAFIATVSEKYHCPQAMPMPMIADDRRPRGRQDEHQDDDQRDEDGARAGT